jgi:hypothetical protein
MIQLASLICRNSLEPCRLSPVGLHRESPTSNIDIVKSYNPTCSNMLDQSSRVCVLNIFQENEGMRTAGVSSKFDCCKCGLMWTQVLSNYLPKRFKKGNAPSSWRFMQSCPHCSTLLSSDIVFELAASSLPPSLMGPHHETKLTTE